MSDFGNNRVLSWPDAQTFANGQLPDMVIGQANFTSNAPNGGGPVSATGLREPMGVAVDAAGNLFVWDSTNHRVLEYDAPLTNHAAAKHVIGQPDFFSSTLNNGGVSANSLGTGYGLAVNARGDLFIADSGNSRVLEYDRPLPLIKVVLPLIRR